MNKIILVVIVVILSGFFFWGKSLKSTPASVQGAKGASLELHDFGRISMREGVVNKEFELKNSSGEDWLVKKVITSCMCTTAYLGALGPFGMPGHGGPTREISEVLKSGESRVLRVEFDPEAHGPAGIGPIDRFVTITLDTGRELQFEVKAYVTP